MLRSLKDLESYNISATDGDIGSVANFLVDDERWTVRYLVAKAGGFFGARRVLISPVSLRHADWSTKSFHVQLTMEKVKHAPGIDSDQSVSRQHEMDLADYYEYPSYWGLAGIWGMGAYPAALASGALGKTGIDRTVPPGDRHLRSVNELRGYHVQGSDEEVGHIQDFIVDDTSWEVRYLVIDTSNSWFGKRVLVAPHWASRVSWSARTIYFHLSREAIRNSPEWKADAAINREYESRLYNYYGRPVYWDMPGLPMTEQPPVHPAAAR